MAAGKKYMYKYMCFMANVLIVYLNTNELQNI